MKRFIRRITEALLFSLAMFALLNIAIVRTNKYKSMGYNTARFMSVPREIDVAVFGSSHGLCSFYLEDYKEFRSFDFTMPGQYYVMDYALLQQYSSHLKRSAVVILPISYFGVYPYHDDAISANKMYYYKVLRPYLIPKWNIIDAIEYTPPIGGYDAWELLGGLVHDVGADEVALHSKFIEKERDGETLAGYSEEKVRDGCVYIYKSWTNSAFSESEYQKNIKAVSDILDLCYAKGFVPVLVSAPVCPELNALYDKEYPEFREIFHRFTRDITAKYKSLVYLDYSVSEAFTERTLFWDVQHLGASGGKAFTAMFLQDAKAQGIVFPETNGQ